MSAYVIASIDLHDSDEYAEYVANVPAIIQRYGGRYLVRGGNVTVQEGSWSPARFVVIEFPDRAAAEGFYEDPEYAPYRALRQRISDSSVIIADGYA